MVRGTAPLTLHYFNAQGLCSKFAALNCYIDQHIPDVLCVSESWLDSNVQDSEIEFAGYKVFWRDRNLGDFPEGTYSMTDRGGILTLVKEKRDFGTESLWVQLEPPGSHPFTFVTCYRLEEAGHDYVVFGLYRHSRYSCDWGF